MAAPTAPEVLRQMSITEFRHTFREIASGVKRHKPSPPVTPIKIPVDDSGASGLFDMLGDDAITRIIEYLMEVPSDTTGLQYLREIEDSRMSVVSLMLTCNRIASLMRDNATAQKAELHARASTKIMPANPSSNTAFTEQVKDELVSCDQLRMLRKAHQAMACHCAKACCLKVQNAFNRDIAKKRIFRRPSSPAAKIPDGVSKSRVIPIMEACSMLAPSESGTSAYAYRRRRLSKVGVHGEARAKRYEDEIVRVVVNDTNACTGGRCSPQTTVTDRCSIDTTEMSEPLIMRSSHDGKAVAWISATHEIEQQAADSTPFSTAFLWCEGQEEFVKLEQPEFNRVLSPQDVWFSTIDVDEGKTVPAVVVAWSTDFVHPSGHHVGSNSPVHLPSGAAYMFATYLVEDNLAFIYSCSFLHENGILISCSPTRDGKEALALVKRTDGWMPGFRCTKLHNIIDDTTLHVPHCVPNSARGPLCATLSPTGDCIVAMHKTDNSIVLSVLVRTTSMGFSPVQKRDLSPWLALKGNDDGMPSSVLQTDLVKASFVLRFSPCGRFVAVHDRHPFFGEPAPAHGLVVVDMALRMDKQQSLRPFPMFSTEEQAPRSFHWTRTGIWMMPPGTDATGSIGSRGGAICLHAPETAGI